MVEVRCDGGPCNKRPAIGIAARWAAVLGGALAVSVSACFLRSAIPGLGSGGLPGQGSPADAATARGAFPPGAIEQAAHDFEATVGASGDVDSALARLL